MSANKSTLPPPTPATEQVFLLDEIKRHELELHDAEMLVATLKGKLDYLRKRYAEGIVIKWREEIRNCMRHVDGYYILIAAHEIISCIEFKNSIQADRNMKNKIATTLSMMHREGEIGKLGSDAGILYGHASLFNDDLKSLKEEYEEILFPI